VNLTGDLTHNPEMRIMSFKYYILAAVVLSLFPTGLLACAGYGPTVAGCMLWALYFALAFFPAVVCGAVVGFLARRSK
jgi:hypothetical protein